MLLKNKETKIFNRRVMSSWGRKTSTNEKKYDQSVLGVCVSC